MICEGKMMETKYKITMKKDAEVMKDFVSFTYRVQGKLSRYKFYVLAIGMLMIGFLAMKGGSMTAGAVIGGIGIAMIVIGIFLPSIAVMKMKKADEAYQKGTELTYAFAKSAIYVYLNGELFQNVGGYNHVTSFYEDEKNYYMGINNEELYLLPKKCFVEGEKATFAEFVKERSNVMCEFLPGTLKNKWLKYRMDVKRKNAEYDERAARLRKEAKEKKAQKRK